jgi:hypothetical protein
MPAAAVRTFPGENGWSGRSPHGYGCG